MSPDNLITNKQVDAGTLPESQRENRPQVSAEGQAAAGRIAAARAERNANPTSVTADQLSQPVSQVTVPQPGQAPTSNPRTSALINSTLGGIRSMSESAQGLRDQQEQLNAFSQDFSATGLNEQFLNKFGVTEERLGRLEQLENQLNSFDAESKNTQSRIGQGNSISQANREITQEDRELAIRSAETASEAEILRGNISLGRELATDAVNLAITDRNFKADSMIRQIKSLESIVDEETRQLLVAEERQYTEIKDRGEELRTSITDAVSSGAATPEEVRQLNALSEPQRADESTEQYFARVRAEDASKLAAAQGIVSRGQTQLRDLEVRQSEASIRQSNASAANSEASRLQTEAETELLTNPSIETNDAETIELVQGLDKGTREQIVNARDTSAELNAMKSILESVDNNLELLTPATEEGREFRRISENVADKLARQRTGAVVSEEEQASFRKIMGLGFFNILSKDDEEITGALDKILSPHSETLRLADPTGEIQSFLDAGTLDIETADEIDVIFGLPAEETEFNASKYY